MPSPPDRPEFWIEDAPERRDSSADWADGSRSGVGWNAPDESRGWQTPASDPNAGQTGTDWSGGAEPYGSPVNAWDAAGPREPNDDGSSGPMRTPRRWIRWAAVGAGLVVIAGLIAWQGGGGQQPEGSEQTVTQTPPTTAPSTWAPTAVGPHLSNTADIDAPTTNFVVDGNGMLVIQPLDDATGASTYRLTDGTVILVNPPPTTTENITAIATTVAPLPDTQGWELQAYRRPLRPGGQLSLDGDAALIRYRPEDGALSAIRLPGLSRDATGPVSFVVSDGSAIIHPDYPSSGYVVSPDGEVSSAAGLLVRPDTTSVFPGPGRGQIWAINLNGGPAVATLANTAGMPLGAEFTAPQPATPWYTSGPVPDGTGYLTIQAVGGTYVLQPVGDGFHRVTTGTVLASGKPGFLTYDCDDDAHCAVYYVDRGTWSKTTVPVDYVPSGGNLPSGVISPDGSTAALADWGGSGAVVYLLDLATGEKTYTDVSLTDMNVSADTGFFAFSPDGRYLMVAGVTGVVPVRVATGAVLPTLPTGPVDALAIEPVG